MKQWKAKVAASGDGGLSIEDMNKALRAARERGPMPDLIFLSLAEYKEMEKDPDAYLRRKARAMWGFMKEEK